MKYYLIPAIGMLAAILANQGIAVFNDGLRPLLPQYFDKHIQRKDLYQRALGVSLGLVFALGLPLIFVSGIFTTHALLLMTDVIGLKFHDDKRGALQSGVIGAIYGLLLVLLYEGFIVILSWLPYNFIDSLPIFGRVLLGVFAIFPSIVVSYQHNIKKGIFTFVLTFIAFIASLRFYDVLGQDPVIVGTVIGLLVMYVLALLKKGTDHSNESLTTIFSAKMQRLRRNSIPLAIMGGLLSLAASLTLLANEPLTLALLSNGASDAAIVGALVRGISFLPMVFTTAIVSGVYGMAGSTLVFAAGYIFMDNPYIAFVAGFIIIIIEIFSLKFVAKGMDRFPGIKDLGEHTRSSLDKLIQFALPIGSIIAAEAMASTFYLYGFGSMFMVGGMMLNRKLKKPIYEEAIGPLLLVVFGFILNFVYWLFIV